MNKPTPGTIIKFTNHSDLRKPPFEDYAIVLRDEDLDGTGYFLLRSITTNEVLAHLLTKPYEIIEDEFIKALYGQ